MNNHTRVAKTHRRGAALVEYAILLALISTVCVAVVTSLGLKVSNLFADADEALILGVVGGNNGGGGGNSN